MKSVSKSNMAQEKKLCGNFTEVPPSIISTTHHLLLQCVYLTRCLWAMKWLIVFQHCCKPYQENFSVSAINMFKLQLSCSRCMPTYLYVNLWFHFSSSGKYKHILFPAPQGSWIPTQPEQIMASGQCRWKPSDPASVKARLGLLKIMCLLCSSWAYIPLAAFPAHCSMIPASHALPP